MNIPVGLTPSRIASSPDGKFVYTADYNSKQISAISTSTQSVLFTVPIPGYPYSLTVCPDGRYLYVITNLNSNDPNSEPDGGYVVSLSSKSVTGSFPVGSLPQNVITSPDGQFVYVSNSGSGDLYQVSTATKKIVSVKTLEGALQGLAYAANSHPIVNNYHFESVDFPGAAQSRLAGINSDGVAVGRYVDQAGITHGFIFRDGDFRGVDYPGATSTVLIGINDDDTISGFFTDDSGIGHGFRLRYGVFSKIEPPDSIDSVADGIDNLGRIVGGFDDVSGTHAFLFANGSYRSFDFPGAATFTQAYGISAAGIVGVYDDANGDTRSFLLRGNQFTPIAFPGTSVPPGGGMESLGINAWGQIVGDYSNFATWPHGFLIDGRQYISFDYPDGGCPADS
jgi:YVTN family beta-propeller protein/probable HAF family extracellular repeat protein